VDSGDDLLGVDALHVDRDAEVGVTELSLDDVQRHALSGELERMGVTELMRKPPGHTASLARRWSSSRTAGLDQARPRVGLSMTHASACALLGKPLDN